MEKFNLEAKIEEQELNEGKVQSDAVAKAKANIAERKAAEEARQVERRLNDAEQIETRALKELRLNRARAEAQKEYLKALNEARANFEKDGDYRAYDTAVNKADNTRSDAISDAKRKIYGDEYWRY